MVKMSLKILMGMVFVIFILILASFFAISSYSTYDQRINVTSGYSDAYNITRNVTGYAVYNMSLLGYIIGILTLIFACIFVIFIIIKR